MQSLVTFNVTIENKFISLMLSIDGLRHPLLRNLAVERAPERRDFELDRSRFVELRGEILRGQDISIVFYFLNSHVPF